MSLPFQLQALPPVFHVFQLVFHDSCVFKLRFSYSFGSKALPNRPEAVTHSLTCAVELGEHKSLLRNAKSKLKNHFFFF